MADFNSLLRLVKDAGLEEDPKVTRWLRIVAKTQDERPKFADRFARKIRERAVERLEYPFTEQVPENSYMDNVVYLGDTLKDGRPYTLKEDDLVQHMLTAGQPGVGKTNLKYVLVSDLRTPFWILDRKRDYRHLIQKMDDLLVLPWNRLKFNPLKPPTGVAPVRWAQVLAEIFGHATSLLSGSKNFLLKSVLELYNQYGLFDDSVSGPYPSVFELQQVIEEENINFVRKSSNYKETVLNRVEPMTLAAGSIFDCSEGYSIEELLDRRVVFELGGLNRDIQNFIQELLIAYVYEYHNAENIRNQGVQLVLIVDEAKQVFSVYKERSDAAGIPKIDDLTALMREFGVALVVSDQEPKKLTDSIKANTKTKVLLPIGDYEQFDDMASTMGLTSDMRRFTRDLGTGEAVMKFGSSDPVPIKIHYYDIEKSVDESDLKEHQEEKWDSLEYEERKPASFETGDTEKGKDGIDPEQIAEQASTEPVVDLSENAEVLLQSIVDEPFLKITERYDRFSSYHKGNEARKELLEEDLVEESSVRKSDSRIKLLELTDRGRKFLESQGVELQRKGRGGVRHRYWQHEIRQFLEDAGWTGKVELFDVDVYGNDGKRELAVEVALSSGDRELEHLQHHSEKDFAVSVVACGSKDILRKLKQKAEENELDIDSVDFRVLQELDSQYFEAL